MTIVRQGVYLPALELKKTSGPGVFNPAKSKVYHGTAKPAPPTKATKPAPTPKPKKEPKPIPPYHETKKEKKAREEHEQRMRELQAHTEEMHRLHPTWPTIATATASQVAAGLPTSLDELSAAPVFDELHDLLGVFGISPGARTAGDDDSSELPADDASTAQAESEAPRSSVWIIGAVALLVLVLAVKGL